MLKQASLRSIALATAALCLSAGFTAGVQVRPAVALTPSELQAAPVEGSLNALDRRLLGDPRLERLYGTRAYQPLWLDAAQSGVSERGEAALRVLADAESEGLDPASYFGREIEAARLAGDWQELDLLISAALLGYAGDMLQGRDDLRSLGAELDGNGTPVDPVAAVSSLSYAPDVAAALAELAPRHPQYQRLRETLVELRQRAAAGGWPRIPDGDTLDPGMTDPRVVVLRERLAVSETAEAVSPGEPASAPDRSVDALSEAPMSPAAMSTAAMSTAAMGPTTTAAGASAVEPTGTAGAQAAAERAAEPAADPAYFDPALEQAVRDFQKRSGLVVDGRVGPNTLAALNRPVGQLIAMVQANLERWRWLPHDLGGRYILVNTAGYNLEAVEDGAVVLRMPVVNGQPSRETPMFSAEMSYLEVNPTWTVPPTIFAKDYLPKLRRDPGYLASQNITLYASWSQNAAPIDPYSVDWHAVPASTRSLPYRLVQAPGPHNALGRIKFMMPNKHSIYLHDTNHRELFSRDMRALSSGCVRLARPDDMARLVLKDAKGWDMDRLQAVYASGQRTRISLQRTWPVHMTYFTAWVDDDGTTHFYDDVYGRDRELLDRMESSNQLLLAEEPVESVEKS